MSWIRSNLAKVGTFAGSVVQKAGDAVERGAKMVYEQAESAVVSFSVCFVFLLAEVGMCARGSVVQKAGDAVERGAKMVYEQAESAVARGAVERNFKMVYVQAQSTVVSYALFVGRPHNSFRHAIRRIEEVASFARGSERKEALARWLAALSDIQQENDRLQAQFQRRKKRQEKEERKTQGGNQQEEVTAESAASAEGSASDAGAAVSSGRTEGVGAEGAVADRADDEGKDHASVTEGNQAKDGEAEGVEAGLSSQVQTDGAEGKTEEHKYRPQVGSKSAEAGDIAAAGEEAEEVASVGDGSSQDEGAPPLSKSASTGRASMVLFYDPDAGNEALNFRDVFLRSSALELIVASMVVAPGDEDEMALLRGLFGALELIVASVVVAPGDEDQMALLRGLFG
ncbi:unnamed protein product [Closterium sp. NIES-54]